MRTIQCSEVKTSSKYFNLRGCGGGGGDEATRKADERGRWGALPTTRVQGARVHTRIPTRSRRNGAHA
jgi:hypothetical protein